MNTNTKNMKTMTYDHDTKTMTYDHNTKTMTYDRNTKTMTYDHDTSNPRSFEKCFLLTISRLTCT